MRRRVLSFSSLGLARSPLSFSSPAACLSIPFASPLKGSGNVLTSNLVAPQIICSSRRGAVSSPSPTPHQEAAALPVQAAASAPEPTISGAKSFSEIPGPKGWPFFGVLNDFIKHGQNRTDLQDRWYNEYGDVIKYSVLGKTIVYLYNPDHIGQVFREEAVWPIREAVDSWLMYRKKKNLPVGTALAKGEEWKRYRTVLNKLLLPQFVEGHVPRVALIADNLAQRVQRSLNAKGEAPSIKDDTLRYGLEAIVAVLLGHKLGLLDAEVAPTAQRFIDAVVGMFRTSNQLEFGPPFWRWWSTNKLKEHFQCWDDIIEIGTKIHQDINANKNPETKFNDNVPNFLSFVQESKELTDSEIYITCAELIAAGVDTTANATLFTLLHLAHNPDVQERLYKEIETVVGKDRLPTAADLRKMPFLKNCVTEAFRLNPITEGNARTTTKDMVIAGYHVPAGTCIHMSNWTTGRNERFFNDALKFNPDRHARGEEGKQHSPFASLAFGSGARMCVGRRVATMEVQMAALRIVQKYKMEYRHPIATPISSLLLMPRMDPDKSIAFTPRE